MSNYVRTKEDYKEIFKKFIDNDRLFDWFEYAKSEETSMPKYLNMSSALTFVKDNFSKKDFERFYEKVLPFEEGPNKTKQEAKELEDKVIDVAIKIYFSIAGRIEMNEVSENKKQFYYMIKVLAAKKKLSLTVFNKLARTLNNPFLFNDREETISTKLPKYSEEEFSKIYQALEESGLAKNDENFRSVWFSCIGKGIVPDYRLEKGIDKYNDYIAKTKKSQSQVR